LSLEIARPNHVNQMISVHLWNGVASVPLELWEPAEDLRCFLLPCAFTVGAYLELPKEVSAPQSHDHLHAQAEYDYTWIAKSDVGYRLGMPSSILATSRPSSRAIVISCTGICYYVAV